jgi:uncharacterized Zn finger protein (UPF0148 family)
MSEFDEEAERARLREQLERDEQRRAETERMSELLLQGATMTNHHCGECGAPIFRHEGQLFCPTCETVVEQPDASVPTAQDDGFPTGESETTQAEPTVAVDGDVEAVIATHLRLAAETTDPQKARAHMEVVSLAVETAGRLG